MRRNDIALSETTIVETLINIAPIAGVNKMPKVAPMPFLADITVAFTSTKGMAKPNAWGQAITNTVTARLIANVKPSGLIDSQMMNVSVATPIAIRVSQ